MTTPSTAGPTPEVVPGPPARVVRRSRNDRVLGGVCGGLARYFQVDPVLLRVAAVALALATGVGVVAYVIAWIVIPEGDDEAGPAPSPGASPALAWYLGVVLVAAGTVLLVRQFVPWFDAGILWPLLIVLAGALVLVSALRGGSDK